MSKPHAKKPKKDRYFIILIGGPGTFQACDRAHDQSWKNYIVPVQLSTKQEMAKHNPPEIVAWWVYAPAYQERWDDDVTYTSSPKPAKPGENLFDQRKKGIDAIKGKGAKSYMERIEQSAKETGVQFKALQTPQDFWDGLKALPDGSLSRVWYVGHASASGLMLKLIHYDDCKAGANPADMVDLSDIAKYKEMLGRKMAKGETSKFYGCSTYQFAEEWSKTFSVTSAGAIHKIDFSVVDSPSETTDILERLEKSNRDTDWQTVGAGGPH